MDQDLITGETLRLTRGEKFVPRTLIIGALVAASAFVMAVTSFADSTARDMLKVEQKKSPRTLTSLAKDGGAHVAGRLSAIPGWEAPRNGITYSGGELGKKLDKKGAVYDRRVTDFDPFINAGAKAIRYPVRHNRVAPDGGLSEWHLNHLVSRAKYITGKGVAFVIDDHSYRDMSNPEIGAFWAKFGVAFEKAMGGTNDLVVFELQNEPATNWNDYGHGLKENIARIRAAGVKSTLAIGWGTWSKPSQFNRAMLEIDKAGGLANLDPLNRLLFVAHDYWEPTGNDLAGKVSGKIVIADRYRSMIAEARKRGVKLIMGEIGLGGGTKGWLPSDGAGSKKDGRTLFLEYVAWANENADVLKGTWAWGGGKLNPGYTYHFSIKSVQGRELAKFWKP